MDNHVEVAILAGGCYWIMQESLRHREGVISTRVGWTGGDDEAPSDEDNKGHAESTEVTFDPHRLSFKELLEVYLRFHRPDLSVDVVGSAYRSEVFYTNDEQRRIAGETIPEVSALQLFPGDFVTKVTPAGAFWEADAEDQNYFQHFSRRVSATRERA